MQTMDTDEIEVARSDLSLDYIHRRIEDWKSRIRKVYGDIKAGAADFRAVVEDGPRVTMHEDLMKRHRVKAEKLPSLIVRRGGGIIKVRPVGLWTIGGNGRIDLVTSNGLFMLVDFPEPFDPSDWKIYGPGRREGIAMGADAFFNLI